MAAVSRRRVMTWLGVGIALYLGVIGLFWLFQERLIFVGAGFGRGVPLDVPVGVEVVRIDHPDGGTFRVAVASAGRDAEGIVVAFVGNGEDLRSGLGHALRFPAYRQHGVVVEYPGYGDSDGSPTRDGVLAAAEAAAAYAGTRFGALPRTAVGTSLGTFSAVHLAARGLVDRIVLRAPPVSIERAGRERYPWLPIGWFLRHRFDSGALAAEVRVPALILHGDRDRIVPAAHGRDLAEQLAGPTDFVLAEGYGHNNIPIDRSGPFGERVARFLAGQ